jgi:hypothetical protein
MKKYGRVVLAATAATSLCAAAADAQTLEGSYRGTFVCEKIKVTTSSTMCSSPGRALI